MKVGVLALQGAFDKHAPILSKEGVTTVWVRKPGHLEGLSGIILPGGESTTMVHLLHLQKLWEPLREFGREAPVWGICAGTILLASQLKGSRQETLGLLDIEVERNAYGRQLESFISELNPTDDWEDDKTVEGVFIRAPRILNTGPCVRILFHWEGESVAVESKNILASTFHPELTDNDKIHRYFIKKCREYHGSSTSKVYSSHCS